jgi:putative endonuclease
MYYVYILQSLVDNKLYTGFTKNLKNRILEHNAKKVASTKKRAPLKLIYFEYSLNMDDALHREKYSPCEIVRLISHSLKKSIYKLVL